MLWAGALALAALDAFAGLALALGDDAVLPLGPEFRTALAAIGHGEDIRDGNAHWTALGAVMAAGTGDRLVRVQRELGLVDRALLVGVQGLEILHKGEVVVHLRQIAHAGEHRDDVLLARHKTDRPGGVGRLRVRLRQDRLDAVDGVCQHAALHRLHDRDGLSIDLADLKVAPGGHAGVLPVRVVDLELDEFHVRMSLQQFLQQLGIGVEGKAVVFDQALRLHLLHKIPDVVFVVFPVVVSLERVKQVVVKIAGARALQAGVKLLLRAGLVVALQPRVQLGGDGIALPRVAVDHRRLQRRLAGAVVVHVGGIKIGPARLDEMIRHLTDLGDVDGAIGILGQPHEAESQLEGVPFQYFAHFNTSSSCL